MQCLLDLLMLFFPSNCLVCGKRLQAPRFVLCLACELKMPRTGFKDVFNNPVSQIFWGRGPVRAGYSLLKFEKGSAYQALIHDLKYRGNIRAGMYLGRLLGQELLHSPLMECDLLIPVPLHRRRFRERGYNQSEIIARGISEVTGIPLASNLIRRAKYQHSQTSLNRQERFVNMSSAFSPRTRVKINPGKKILIIDDIITTGATLEACSQVLSDHYKCQINIATVSYA